MTEYQSVPLLLSAKISRRLAIKEYTVRNTNCLGHLHARLLHFKTDKYGHWEEQTMVVPVRSFEIKKATTSAGKVDAID